MLTHVLLDAILYLESGDSMSKKDKTMHDMIQLTFGEEIGNTITHGVMAVLILLFLPFTAIYTFIKGGWLYGIGTSIMMISLFMMFLISTLYHSMEFSSKQKYVFRILDHSCIFLAIAGTYTPIVLCVMSGWQQIILLLIEWGALIIGVLYKSIAQKSNMKLSVAIYLAMGWVAIFFLPSLLTSTTWHFMALIILGGILYSIGIIFYSQKTRYFHMIWHIFINLASISHIIAIVFFLL